MLTETILVNIIKEATGNTGHHLDSFFQRDSELTAQMQQAAGACNYTLFASLRDKRNHLRDWRHAS